MRVHELLPKSPISVNEVLDLFEAYVATIGAPLITATDLIRHELNYNQGDIFGHICGVASNSHDMAKRLKQIRADRNAGTDVTMTLTHDQWHRFELATGEVPYLLDHAASVFEFLHSLHACGISANDDGYQSILELCARAFRGAAAKEGESIGQLDRILRDSARVTREAERQAQIDGGAK